MPETKKVGSRVELDRHELLDLARQLAVEHAKEFSLGLATVDDVTDALERLGHDPRRLGRSLGNVFRGPEWKPFGSPLTTYRSSGGVRTIRVWRLVGTAPRWVLD